MFLVKTWCWGSVSGGSEIQMKLLVMKLLRVSMRLPEKHGREAWTWWNHYPSPAGFLPDTFLFWASHTPQRSLEKNNYFFGQNLTPLVMWQISAGTGQEPVEKPTKDGPKLSQTCSAFFLSSAHSAQIVPTGSLVVPDLLKPVQIREILVSIS